MAKKNQQYPEKIGFMVSKHLKNKLGDYSKEEGVKPAVILRKALVAYLREKGKLEADKNFL